MAGQNPCFVYDNAATGNIQIKRQKQGVFLFFLSYLYAFFLSYLCADLAASKKRWSRLSNPTHSQKLALIRAIIKTPFFGQVYTLLDQKQKINSSDEQEKKESRLHIQFLCIEKWPSYYLFIFSLHLKKSTSPLLSGETLSISKYFKN